MLELVDSSPSTKPPHQILFFATSPSLLMSTLAQTCAECNRSNDIAQASFSDDLHTRPALVGKAKPSQGRGLGG